MNKYVKRIFGGIGVLFFIIKPLIFVALSFAAFVVFIYIMTILTIIDGIEYLFKTRK